MTEIADPIIAARVKFPAVQVPSSDANTLDDYEEGEFTATLTCGTSGTITLGTANVLRYIKNGGLVTVFGFINVLSVSSPVGTLTLGGMPFTPVTGNKYRSGFGIWATGLAATAVTALTGRMNNGAATCVIYTRFAAGVATSNAADVLADTDLAFNFTYQSA